MNGTKIICITLFCSITCVAGWAQDSSSAKEKWVINGYLKNLGIFSFDKNFDKAAAGYLFHNRINVKWKPVEKLTAAIEVRNRFYYGDDIQNTPGFVDQFSKENGWMDLSVVWTDETSFVFVSNIDRLWLEFRQPRWNARVGRQRINWGMATIWNPNDIFNTYNFLDFDYEERPGCDAAKFQYLFGNQSNLEVAISQLGDNKETIAAARYFINRWGYDLQVLAGKYQDAITAGLGWAGNLGDMGFKGESQVFFNDNDSGTSFNYTVELNYVFKKGWYLGVSVLHNALGVSDPVDDLSKIDFQFSPMNLMPGRWNLLAYTSKEFTPRFSGNLSVVYSPGVNLFIVYPFLKYNLATNLDLDWVWQSFFLELDRRFQAANHRCFLRLKWNF